MKVLRGLCGALQLSCRARECRSFVVLDNVHVLGQNQYVGNIGGTQGLSERRSCQCHSGEFLCTLEKQRSTEIRETRKTQGIRLLLVVGQRLGEGLATLALKRFPIPARVG